MSQVISSVAARRSGESSDFPKRLIRQPGITLVRACCLSSSAAAKVAWTQGTKGNNLACMGISDGPDS